MYKLLVNHYIKRQGFYEIKNWGKTVIIYRNHQVVRKFDSYKECYKFLKMMAWLELI